jgi:poly(A) polymerase
VWIVAGDEAPYRYGNFIKEHSFFGGDLIDIFNGDDRISEITEVKDAYVPIIKMKVNGIPTDLLFSKLDLPFLSDDLLQSSILNKDVIIYCNERESITSLSGFRVGHSLLKLT